MSGMDNVGEGEDGGRNDGLSRYIAGLTIEN